MLSCGYIRKAGRKLFCLRRDIFPYIKPSPVKVTWKSELHFAVLNLRAARCTEERTNSAWRSRSRAVHTSGHNKLPPQSSNASQLHQLQFACTLRSNSPIFVPITLQVWCHAFPKSHAEQAYCRHPKAWVYDG